MLRSTVVDAVEEFTKTVGGDAKLTHDVRPIRCTLDAVGRRFYVPLRLGVWPDLHERARACPTLGVAQMTDLRQAAVATADDRRMKTLIFALLVAALTIVIVPVASAKQSAPNVQAAALKSGANAGKVLRIHTMKVVCRSIYSDYRTACVDSYEYCSIEAAAKVKAYYNGRGPDLDLVARRYARAWYDPNRRPGFFEGGVAGCQGALVAEYDRLYR